ncbi:MAG: hypothetical protein HY093_04450 [Candidatus Liptonbacteria bacterium]|nr:hypothetical protein [Candidatus Liptonbacteria bacterium]
MKRFLLTVFSLAFIALPASVHGDEASSSPNPSPTPSSALVFTCGDINHDGKIDETDITLLVDYVFRGGTVVDVKSTDLNGDGVSDVLDVVALIGYVKRGGLPPACVCGDLNSDRSLDQSDVDALVLYVFGGGDVPQGEVDLNHDGVSDILDVVTLINYVHRHGSSPTCGVVISAENHPPTFVNFNPSTSTFATENYSYDVDATDPENDSLVFSLLASPGDMSINSSTGLIAWTPVASEATDTPYLVSVQVSDGLSSASTTYLLTVLPKAPPANGNNNNGGGGGGGNFGVGGGGGLILGSPNSTSSSSTSGLPPNLPPEFVNFTPPTSTTATWLYLYTVQARDPEGKPLNFRLIEGPAGMAIMNFTGAMIWVPTLDQATSTPYPVTIEISDGVNVVTSSYSIIVVKPPILPSTTSPAPIEPPPQKETPPPVELPEPSTSTPSSTAETKNPAGDQSLVAVTIAGLTNFFTDLGDWILSHPLLSMFFLALLFILWLIFFRHPEKKLKNTEPEVMPDQTPSLEPNFEPILNSTPEAMPLSPGLIGESDSGYI